MTRPALFTALAATALLAGALIGCASDDPRAEELPSPVIDETPTPTPTPSASLLPDDVLFVISGTVTAPSGESAHVVQTVFAPTTATAAADTAALAAAECGELGADPTFLHVEVETTMVSGPTLPDLVLITIPLDGAAISWTGAAATPGNAYCASGGALPGSALGIIAVPASGGPDDPGGWGTLRYGINGYVLPPDPEGPEDVEALPIADCRIVRGPASLASARVSAWDVASPVLPGSCVFGAGWG